MDHSDVIVKSTNVCSDDAILDNLSNTLLVDGKTTINYKKCRLNKNITETFVTPCVGSIGFHNNITQ